MAVLEAMAAGLTVVAVRSSGIDDVVQNGFNGFKTGEDHEEWIARARELLIDDGLRAELARNARSFARQFDVKPFAREIPDFYATVLARHQEEERER